MKIQQYVGKYNYAKEWIGLIDRGGLFQSFFKTLLFAAGVLRCSLVLLHPCGSQGMTSFSDIKFNYSCNNLSASL